MLQAKRFWKQKNSNLLLSRDRKIGFLILNWFPKAKQWYTRKKILNGGIKIEELYNTVLFNLETPN